MTVLDYINDKGWQYKEVRRPSGLQYITRCPFCGGDGFAIDAEKGLYNCFHLNKCTNRNGTFRQLQEAVDGRVSIRLDDNIKFTQIKKEYKRPVEQEKPITIKGLDWLHSRKISDKTISKYKLREDKPGWVTFPYYKNGELYNNKHRQVVTKKFLNSKGKEPSLYGRDFIKNREELTIVEGEMDCLAMDTYGIPSVSVPDGAGGHGDWITLEWEWLQEFKRINLALDMDKAGRDGKKDLAQRLGLEKCFDVELPYKDANECLMKGVSAEEVNRCIDNSKHFPIEGIESAEYFLEEIYDDIENPERLKGIETPFSNLNKVIRGFRMNELTVVAGSNHSGKTTMLGQIVTYLARHDYVTCMASLEMPPKKTLEWMIKQNSWQGQLTKESAKEVIQNQLAGKLFFLNIVGTVTPEILFRTWDLSARMHGTKFFVLDSLMTISLPGTNLYRSQSEFVSQLVSFSHEWKCHIFLIAHVRKSERDNYSSGKVDIAGTADITNLAHNVLMVERVDSDNSNKTKEDLKAQGMFINGDINTKIKIKKCREVGTTGEVLFSFNPQTKTFTEAR